MSVLDNISVETILDRFGYRYKITHGASGPQVNVRDCPRCGDSRYKLYFNRETGAGICYVCPDGNNIFNKFSLMKSIMGDPNHRDVFEQLKALSQERFIWQQPIGRQLKNALYLPESIPLPYMGMLPSYLLQRHVTTDIADQFELRYCHRGEFKYRTDDDQERAMDFSQRIIFPIYDETGLLVSFQGRDMTGLSKKKYLFPPGFSTSGKVLYNAQRAVGAQTVVIGEGVFDALALQRALQAIPGVTALASFGKHLSTKTADSDQLSVLLKLRKWFGLERIVMAWDAEREAIRATSNVMQRLQSVGFQTAWMRLPNDKDPADLPDATLLDCFHRSESYSLSLMTKMRIGLC